MTLSQIDIAEQIQKVTNDMKQLIKDISNTDIKNIDVKQIQQFGLFCKNYAIEIQELVYDLKSKVE